MEVHRSVTEFFHEEVTKALETREVDATPPTEFYLVNLLVDFTKTNQIDQEPIAMKMASAQSADPQARARTLKEIGDTTLYVSGFFADSLTRKLVDVDYYIAMGEAAYGQLAGLAAWMRGVGAQYPEVYNELSGKFPKFVEVFAEIRQRTNFAGGANILRLCEEWLKTGEEWLEKRLKASGVIVGAAANDQGKKIIH
jgi:hypothetical protein